MSWTEITRRQYRRDGLRYASDMTDEEWQLIAPHLPPAKPLGRPRDDRPARGGERDALRADDGLPVAPAAQGLPALHHGAAVLLRLARRRDLAADQPSSAAGGARGDGPRGQPVGRGDRQPVGQDDRGRRAARLRRRQEDQGPQAPYPDRYQRVAGRGHRPRGRHPGPRRGGAAAGLDPPSPSPGCATSSPMAAMPAPSCRPRWPRSARGRWRSSSGPTPPKASSCCPAAGWSSARSLGSTATAASPRTSRRSIETATAWLMLASVKLLIAQVGERIINLWDIESGSKSPQLAPTSGPASLRWG